MKGRPKGSKDKKKRKASPHGAFTGHWGTGKNWDKRLIARELRGEK